MGFAVISAMEIKFREIPSIIIAYIVFLEVEYCNMCW